MNKRKQKKIFLGFSILAFLISSATAIWTIWNAKDNKKFSEYDKLIEELKKEKNLVLSPEHKKKAEDFLNNPRYKNSSKENIEIIKKVINEIKNQNSKEKDKIKDL
ncbi:hypothetical protein OM999_01655 [Mycoplasmopsis cynos]|nr:hypothetical protein OM999_01655 [Mycoplasmopsis cynos]